MLAGIETAGYRSQKSGARSQNGEASFLGLTAFAETLGDVGRNRNCGIWKPEVRSQKPELAKRACWARLRLRKPSAMLAGIETAGYRSQKSGARSQNGE